MKKLDVLMKTVKPNTNFSYYFLMDKPVKLLKFTVSFFLPVDRTECLQAFNCLYIVNSWPLWLRKYCSLWQKYIFKAYTVHE